MKTSVKLFSLRILDIILMILPIAIVLFTNKSKYFKVNTKQTYSLSLGLILGLFFIILMLLGKLKNIGGAKASAIVCLLAYLLKPILSDLFILSLATTIGLIFDGIIKIYITKLEKLRDMETNAEITAKAFKKPIEEEDTGGRA